MRERTGAQDCEGYKKVCTVHACPSVEQRLISLTTYTINVDCSVLSHASCLLWGCFQSAGQQVCHYVRQALGVSGRQAARHWKPGHSSRNICPPDLAGGWRHPRLAKTSTAVTRCSWMYSMENSTQQLENYAFMQMLIPEAVEKILN